MNNNCIHCGQAALFAHRGDPVCPDCLEEGYEGRSAASDSPEESTPAPSDQAGNSYLVWSNEHKAWWGPEHRGYTCVIANAGRYDRAEALKIAGTRDGGWWLNKGNPDEIAIPEQDAIDQYADITRAQEATTPTLTAGEGGGDE